MTSTSTSEAQAMIDDVKEIVNEFGEYYTFIRGGVKMARITCAVGKVNSSNIQASGPGPIENQARMITVPVHKTFVPEIFDVVQDTLNNTWTITAVDLFRYQGSTVCYNVSM